MWYIHIMENYTAWKWTYYNYIQHEWIPQTVLSERHQTPNNAFCKISFVFYLKQAD